MLKKSVLLFIIFTLGFSLSAFVAPWFFPNTFSWLTPTKNLQSSQSSTSDTISPSLESEQELVILGEVPTTVPAPQSSPEPPKNIKLLFGGDLMFDRHIRLHMAKNSPEFILEPLKNTFAKYDIVIANLEGPVTTSPSKSVNSVVGSSSNFIFTFEPKILPMLYQNKFTIVNIGNNHITNFGEAGITQTKAFLTENKIKFFGNTHSEKSPKERVYVHSTTTPTLAFVNFNQFVAGGFEAAVADVKYASTQAEMVIVMPHWGNEYESVANKVVQNWAHKLVDAGADLIIGGHPHVIQQREEYQGKIIYYSLGNFVFDQYFEPRVKEGLLVGVEISPDGSIITTELPIKIEKTGQTLLKQQDSPESQSAP